MLLGTLILLSACDDIEFGNNQTRINDLALTGTDGVVVGIGTEATKAAVNSAENGGVFQVLWDVSAASRPHAIRLAVSRDAFLDEGNDGDAFFFAQGCNSSGGTGACPGERITVNCTFSSSVTLGCALGGNQPADLSTYFAADPGPGLPGDYFVILEACDTNRSDCRTLAVPTRFE